MSFCPCYLLNAKQDRMIFVSTRVTKWKTPNNTYMYIIVQRKLSQISMDFFLKFTTGTEIIFLFSQIKSLLHKINGIYYN